MLKVLGSSAATKYQINRYFTEHGVNGKDDLINLYIKYGVEFNIEYELAIGMALMYTDYFTKPIVDNNLCGIGLQFGTGYLEAFASEEDCVIAQYELLRAGADFYFECVDPHSRTYWKLVNHVDDEGNSVIIKGNIESISAVFEHWNYATITNHTLEDLWKASRDITIIREKKKEYVTDRKRHFFISVATATRRESLYIMKRDLFRLGFRQLSIVVDNGFYRLEVGKCDSEKETLAIKDNLAIFGYTGTMKYRDAQEEEENATQTTHE